MSYAVCRMQELKADRLAGMQYHNHREPQSRTHVYIHSAVALEYHYMQNDKNANRSESLKYMFDSHLTGPRTTCLDAFVVNELLVPSDRDFTERLYARNRKRFHDECDSL